MANQALQNLKRIHELQKEGEISKILQDLKNSRSKVEELGSAISKRIKEINFEVARKEELKKEE